MENSNTNVLIAIKRDFHDIRISLLYLQVEWAEIGGFVCITVALLLFVLMKFSDLSGNKPAAICSMVFAIAAGNTFNMFRIQSYRSWLILIAGWTSGSQINSGSKFPVSRVGEEKMKLPRSTPEKYPRVPEMSFSRVEEFLLRLGICYFLSLFINQKYNSQTSWTFLWDAHNFACDIRVRGGSRASSRRGHQLPAGSPTQYIY